MLSEAGIVTAIVYEQSKAFLKPSSLFPRIEAIIEDRLPEDGSHGSCDGTILCTRQGARHRIGCQGKTEPFNAYVRGLQ